MRLAPATKDELRDLGFPEDYVEAFCTTADETNCVVLVRAPGGATTELIRAGYDLKGFFIKAKSADWGPMSGFLCQVPAFGKKGALGIEDNAEANLHYYEEYTTEGFSPIESRRPLDYVRQKLEAKLGRKLTPQEWEGIDSRLSAWVWGDAKGKPPEVFRKLLKDRLNAKPNPGLQYLVGVVVQELTPSLDKEPREKVTDAFQDLGKEEILDRKDSPFVRLKVPRNVLAQASTIQGKPPHEWSCGVAYKAIDDESTTPTAVWFKFVAKQVRDDLYALYHGPVRVLFGKEAKSLFSWYPSPPWKSKGDAKGKREADRATLGVFDPSKKEGQTLGELFPEDSVQVEQALASEWETFATKHRECSVGDAPTEERFYPLCGIQNPYPPYKAPKVAADHDKTHLNAVSGDYDLFACWPVIPNLHERSLVRSSEDEGGGGTGREGKPTPTTLFEAIPGRRYTLRSTVSPNVLVEFIPRSDEMPKGDHPSVGNFNSLVLNVAGTLNSIVTDVKSLGPRNVAFHSDEGGRPGRTEIDWPVTAFIPRALLTTARNRLYPQDAQGKLVEPGENRVSSAFGFKKLAEHEGERLKLLALILALRHECYVPLHFAWVYDFFNHLKDADEGDADEGEESLTMRNGLGWLFCQPKMNKLSGSALDHLNRLGAAFLALFSADGKDTHTLGKIEAFMKAVNS